MLWFNAIRLRLNVAPYHTDDLFSLLAACCCCSFHSFRFSTIMVGFPVRSYNIFHLENIRILLPRGQMGSLYPHSKQSSSIPSPSLFFANISLIEYFGRQHDWADFSNPFPNFRAWITDPVTVDGMDDVVGIFTLSDHSRLFLDGPIVTRFESITQVRHTFVGNIAPVVQTSANANIRRLFGWRSWSGRSLRCDWVVSTPNFGATVLNLWKSFLRIRQL